MNNNSIMLIDKQMTVKYFSNLNIFGPASCKIFEKIAMIVQKSIIVKLLKIGLKFLKRSVKTNCSIIIAIPL
jgi:hypothetical protein